MDKEIHYFSIEMVLLFQYLLEKKGDKVSNISKVLGGRYKVALEKCKPFLCVEQKRVSGLPCLWIGISKENNVEVKGMDEVIITCK